MSAKQKVNGIAAGIDLNSAIESALKSAKAPAQGFDFQTLRVDSIEVERGGFTGEFKTRISGVVIDGDFGSKNKTKGPFPRFDSLDEYPTVQGGLKAETVSKLESEGWQIRTLKGDREDIPVSFRSDKTPSGLIIKYGTVPDGTVVIENDILGQTIIIRCGNQCPILNKDYVVGGGH